MSIQAHMGRLTITENGKIIYDGDAHYGLTPITPSLEVSRDGSSWTYFSAWGRSFQYTITTPDINEL